MPTFNPPHTIFRATKTVTFDGTSGLGLQNTATNLFTITGCVMVAYLTPFCSTNLGESAATARISLGFTGDVEGIIAYTTSTDIDANEFWTATTPVANGVALPSALKNIYAFATNILVHAENVAANTNAGVITFFALWYPMRAGSSLVAA